MTNTEMANELFDYVIASIEAEKRAMKDYHDLASEEYHKGVIYAFECMKMKLIEKESINAKTKVRDMDKVYTNTLRKIKEEVREEFDDPYSYVVKQDALNGFIHIINKYIRGVAE